MEHNTVTLDTAKKLKEAGFPQESYFKWNFNNAVPEQGWYLDYDNLAYEDDATVTAPTAQEIADQLPGQPKPSFELSIDQVHGTWEAMYTGYEYGELSNYGYDGKNYPNLCEALAALWLKLHETSTTQQTTNLAAPSDVNNVKAQEGE